MLKVILTDRLIRSIEVDQRAEFHVWDSQLPGFGVRVRTSGHKTYVLFYRPRNRSRVRKLTLGRADAINATVARRQARELLGQIAAGEDPADRKLAYRNSSLRSAYDAFKLEHLPKVSPEHSKHRQRIFERHFLPKLGDKVLSDISRAEIKDIVDKISRKHKVAANNAHRAFSAFLSWCLDHGLIEHHVLRGSKLPTPYRPRERVLNEVELVQVWNATAKLPAIWKAYFRMLIASGQRRSEVAGMHWDELDLTQMQWVIPESRTKNRRQHVVPISSLMAKILNEAPGKTGFVFPSPIDRKRPIHSFGRSTEALRSHAKVLAFRLHDLRRTAASAMGKLEVPPHVIEAILNHRSGIISGIAAIYNKYGYEREKLLGLSRYGDYIATLTGETTHTDRANETTKPFETTIIPAARLARIARG